MPSIFHTPDHDRASFARTNLQTIAQRVRILVELFPNLQSVAEVCSGDCFNQWQAYSQAFQLNTFVALDIDPVVVSMNQKHGIRCHHGDALDQDSIRSFLPIEVIFFGPPLSVDCAGHTLLAFPKVVPGYFAFTSLLFGELDYQGTIVCIGSKRTTMGDLRWLYDFLKVERPNLGLRLIHRSYSTLTSSGESTEPRLKYVEAWFSANLDDQWEIRESIGMQPP